MKDLIKRYLKYFTYFYRYVRYRFFIALLLSLLVGILDGVGLAMFLPLLQMVEGGSAASTDGMGNLSFIIGIFESLEIDLTLNVVLLFILFLFLLKGLFKYIEGFYNVHIQQMFIMKIRKMCVEKFNNYQYKSYIKSDSGRIQNTLTAEVGRVTNAYRNYRISVQNLIFVSVYIFLAFLSNPQFAILVAIGGVATSFIFTRIYKFTKKISESITKNGHRYHGLIIQSVGFFKYLKSTGQMEDFSEKLNESIEKVERDNKKIGLLQSLLAAVREPVVLTVVVAVIFVQVNYFDQSLNLIILSLLFFYRALNFLMVYQTQWNLFLGLSGSMVNMELFLNDLEDNKEVFGKYKLNSFNSEIILSDVSFEYNENDKILKNINLKLNRNSSYAFVGESGSGKTTLVNLICGLLDCNSGEIIIDNRNRKNIDIRSFQRRIGYITQEPVIFNDDVFNNVTFWDERTPENLSRFWDSLTKASLFEFIKSLPEQEKSPLGNNGVMVSGGQKQRISIARELYKNIDILIMDEATSALDSETERAIQENIDQLKGQYTVLIVAHRLSTIRNVDGVVLMNRGEVVDFGSFSELTKRNSYFERMVNLQELS